MEVENLKKLKRKKIIFRMKSIIYLIRIGHLKIKINKKL
jgi:hypothetical protein